MKTKTKNFLIILGIVILAILSLIDVITDAFNIRFYINLF